jgi:hypothetical protein
VTRYSMAATAIELWMCKQALRLGVLQPSELPLEQCVLQCSMCELRVANADGQHCTCRMAGDSASGAISINQYWLGTMSAQSMYCM